MPFNHKGCVVWITGLSGAGKTTLATALVGELCQHEMKAVLLDGDVLREVLGADEIGAGFHSTEKRLRLAKRYARLCQVLSSQNLIVVIATISLFSEVHRWNRLNFPAYVEVLIDLPLHELRRRDPKGIYRRFDSGDISDVAGLDLKVDMPLNPDLKLSNYSVSEAVNTLKKRIQACVA